MSYEMHRRSSLGIQDGSDDEGGSLIPPKATQGLWSSLPVPTAVGGGASPRLGWSRKGSTYDSVSQDERSPARTVGLEGLALVGEGSPRLGAPVSSRQRRKPALSVAKRTRSWLICGGAFGFSLLLLVKVFSFSRPPPYLCPDPRLPRPSQQHNPRDFTSPVAIPSASPDFALFLSYSTSTCNSFDLEIARTDSTRCAKMERRGKPAEGEHEVEAFIREKLGPDSFNLQVEGAERVALEIPSDYKGDCRYLYRFRLNNAGKVWLNASWTYTDFEAFKEVDSPEGSRHKPDIFMQPLLAQPLELDLCADRCTPFVPSRLGSASFTPPIVRAPITSSLLSSTAFHFGHSSSRRLSSPPNSPHLSSSLPSCHTLPRPLDGSYVPSPYLDLVHPPFPVPLDARFTRPTAGLYSFVPNGCEWKHAGRRFVDHTSCITGQHNAFLIGDSHARAVFDVVKHRLEGNDDVATVSSKALSKSAHIGNLYLEFAWDPYLTLGLDCEFIRKYDSIAISSGTHQLSWNCPRAPVFLASLDKILTQWPALLRTCHARYATHKNPRLLFLTMPAFHPQLHNHDCRTGPRISYLNARLAETAKENGWEVLDVERYVKPVAVDQLVGDGVHYVKLDAAEPIADEFIDLLGICDDGSRAGASVVQRDEETEE